MAAGSETLRKELEAAGGKVARLTVVFWRDGQGDVMAAVEESPGLSAFGRTPAEAVKSFGEMFALVGETFIESGDCFEGLKVL